MSNAELLEQASPAKLTELKEVTTTGTFRVPLIKLNVVKYPNYRRSVTETHIRNLQNALGMNKNGEQLTTMNGAWQVDGTIAVVAGFCREEAMERNALKKVIESFNEEHKLSSGDAGYVPLGGNGFKSREDRVRIRNTSPEWAAKYDAALSSYMCDITTSPVDNPLDAMRRNLEENTLREDACLFDETARIYDMIEMGMKQKDIATCIGESQSAISQYRKIWDLFEEFPKIIEANTVAGTIDRNNATAALTDFMRRVNLNKKHDLKITFSHARDFSGIVLHKDKPLPWAQTFGLLKVLVNMQPNGTIPPTMATMDYSLWKVRCNEAQLQAKAPVVATPVAGAGAVTAEPSAVGVEQGAIHDATSLAAQQLATQATQTTVPKTTEVVRPGDALAQQQIADANAVKSNAAVLPVASTLPPNQTVAAKDKDAPDQDDEYEGESGNANDVLASLAGAGVPVVAPIATGQKTTSTVDAPVTKTVMSSPEKLQSNAYRCVALALDPETNDVDRACQMLSAVTLFDAIGLKVESDAANFAYIDYVEHLIDQVKFLRTYFDKSSSDADKAKLATLTVAMSQPDFPTTES